MCVAITDVRFTPNSDRESGHQQTVMSALPPKADMCSAMADVCFGPKADIKLTAELKARTSFGNQARNVNSSSFSAHFITSSSFSLPCVNFDTMTVLMARL